MRFEINLEYPENLHCKRNFYLLGAKKKRALR